jgi:hypothetical protein
MALELLKAMTEVRSMKRPRTFVFSLFMIGLFLSSQPSPASDYSDPSYGTGDPPNYKKKQQSSSSNSHSSPYVYSSRFNDFNYGTSNPPGYNERKAKEIGKIYVPPTAEKLPPVYGTGVRSRRSIRRR